MHFEIEDKYPSCAFIDRFVGMLPQEQLQQYLVRAVTGYGERVQGQEVSEKDLADITNAVRILAGML